MTLDLLTWSASPTTSGPRSPASDGTPARATPAERWAVFVEAHADVAAWVLAQARGALERGETRVSAKALAEQARERFRVPLNNTAVAAMASWLVEQDARLDEVIERRVRKVK